MKKVLKYSTLLISFVPLIAAAQTSSGVTDILDRFSGLINGIIGILFAIGLLVFIWGVVRFVASAGDEKARTEGKNFMTWGIVGLVIMASVWGLVGAIVRYFGLNQQRTEVNIPKVPQVDLSR